MKDQTTSATPALLPHDLFAIAMSAHDIGHGDIDQLRTAYARMPALIASIQSDSHGHIDTESRWNVIGVLTDASMEARRASDAQVGRAYASWHATAPTLNPDVVSDAKMLYGEAGFWTGIAFAYAVLKGGAK